MTTKCTTKEKDRSESRPNSITVVIRRSVHLDDEGKKERKN